MYCVYSESMPVFHPHNNIIPACIVYNSESMPVFHPHNNIIPARIVYIVSLPLHLQGSGCVRWKGLTHRPTSGASLLPCTIAEPGWLSLHSEVHVVYTHCIMVSVCTMLSAHDTQAENVDQSAI